MHLNSLTKCRLNDGDDDVKSVAASCLLPVAEHIVAHLPSSLDRILVVLWHCLSTMKDDLSSSVGVVMDLLGIYTYFCICFRVPYADNYFSGKLIGYDKVIDILAKDEIA